MVILFLQTYNALVMVLARIKDYVMSQLELVFVISDLKEICVKVNSFFS